MIVGGGAVATRKAVSLLEAGAVVRVIAPDVSSELTGIAAQNERLSLLPREYSGIDDIHDAEIVIAATDAAGVNSRVATDARSLHRLVSVVSSPAEGNWSSMAVHRSGQLTVGVSAGNVPVAAARIRDAIAERFDDRYASALERCADMRTGTLAAKGREEWARVSETLLGPDFCGRVENGVFEEAQS